MKSLFKLRSMPLRLGKSTILLMTVMMLMSSCVYSLFPIYTDETVVFDPLLLGTWEDNDGYSLTFEKISKNETDDKTEKKEKTNYTDSLIGDGWSIRSEDTISIEIGSKTVYEKELIKAHMDSIMNGLSDLGNEEEESDDKISSANWLLNQSSVKGSVSFSGEKTYRMIVQQNEDEASVYKVHLVKIGDNHFIDLFPIIDTNHGAFTENLFPVHTFMKIDFNANQLELTSFDLEKLNEMFVKNLVRLRHENVNGTILITAQPEELQKFLKVYSDVKEVYENATTYRKVAG